MSTIVLIVLASTTGIVLLILAAVGKKRRHQIYATFQTPTPILLVATLEKLSLPIPAWLRRWVRWSKLGSVERSFHMVHRSLHWLGVQSNPAHTPAESAELLSHLLPDATVEIQTLLHEYQQTIFSPHPGDPVIAHEAAKSLRRACLHAPVQSQMNIKIMKDRQRIPLRGTLSQPRDRKD